MFSNSARRTSTGVIFSTSTDVAVYQRQHESTGYADGPLIDEDSVKVVVAAVESCLADGRWRDAADRISRVRGEQSVFHATLVDEVPRRGPRLSEYKAHEVSRKIYCLLTRPHVAMAIRSIRATLADPDLLSQDIESRTSISELHDVSKATRDALRKRGMLIVSQVVEALEQSVSGSLTYVVDPSCDAEISQFLRYAGLLGEKRSAWMRKQELCNRKNDTSELDAYRRARKPRAGGKFAPASPAERQAIFAEWKQVRRYEEVAKRVGRDAKTVKRIVEQMVMNGGA